MEWQSEQRIWAIDKSIDKTILVDGIFSTCNSHPVARLMVEIDVKGALLESIDLVVEGKKYTKILDYLNIPFR